MTAAHRQRACSLGDIDGGNEIGMVLETTGFATEMGLGRAIALLTVPTSWAGAGSVPGVYIDNRDASLQGFVFDEPLEFTKGPGVYICSLLLGDSYPFPYILEVFQHQDVAWLQRFNDSLGHDMVDVAHPSALLARQPFQESLGSFCALLLERLTELTEMPVASHDCPAREDTTVRDNSDVLQPTVNPDGAFAFWVRDGSGQGDVDVELVLLSGVYKCCGSRVLSCQQMPLVVANLNGQHQAANMGRDGDGFFSRDPSERSLIKADAHWPEPTYLTGLALHGLGYPGDSPDNQIRLKTIASLNLLVTKVLELDLVGGLMLQSNLPDVLAGRGKPGHGFQKNRCFFLTDLELATYCFNEGCHAITDHIIT